MRKLLDDFEVQGVDGNTHVCLVHEPLSLSIEEMRLSSPDGRLAPFRVKVVLRHMLLALEFLHTSAKKIHGGLWCAACK